MFVDKQSEAIVLVERMTEEIVMNSTNNIDNNKRTPMDDIIVKHKKKQGAFGFLRAASLKFRRRSLDLKQQKFTPVCFENFIIVDTYIVVIH